MINRPLVLLIFLFCFGSVVAQEKAAAPATAGMDKMPGFITMYWDAKKRENLAGTG